MTEDNGLIIDIRRLFPAAVKRVEILERLKREWLYVVKLPAVARYSKPAVLGVNYLTVDTWNDNARGTLINMKGNIQRILSGFGYEPDGNFSLRFSERGTVKKRTAAKNNSPHPKITADDETVRRYMAGAPETLPEDINYALSHLRAYLDAAKIITSAP